MSSTELSTTSAWVEKSLFKALLVEGVAKGYCPDVTTFPQTPQGVLGYKAAMAAIKDSMGFCIQLFGVGSNRSKYLKVMPRIVITKSNNLMGSLGGSPAPEYEFDGEYYQKRVAPPQTKDYTYNIYITALNHQEMRVMEALLSLALPIRGYINSHDETSQIFLEQTGFTQSNNVTDGIMENIYAYTASDLYETEHVVVANQISPINQITVETYLPDIDHPGPTIVDNA